MSEQPLKHRFASVQRCSCCGQDHDSVEFLPYRGAPAKAPDAVSYDWWGYCPVTGDPILLKDEAAPPARSVLGGEVKK